MFFSAPMIRFPIPAKLCAGLLVNLALLGIGFFAVFRAQFGSASNQFFASIAEPRVQALAERLSGELRQQDPSRWDAFLREQGGDGPVTFSLFDGDLGWMAGSVESLPEDVRRQVRDVLAPRSGERPPPDRGERGQPRPEPPFPGDGFDPFPPPPRPPHREPPLMDPGMASYPKATARSSAPAAYWVICRVPVLESGRGYLPLVLVMRSTSLTGGGIFFDPVPWILAAAGVLLVSGLIWVPLAIGLTRSLRRIQKATGRIADGDFRVALPDVRRGDELGDLGRSVVQMAGRLESHVAGQKRFLGDIAHELCSPIARLQASLGILEQMEGLDETRRRYLHKVETEVHQMSALVNELLSFSKAGLKRGVDWQPVRLADLVREVLEREEPGSRGVRVAIPEDLQVQADPELLGRAIGNLWRNAVRYAGEAGAIEFQAEHADGGVLLNVRDEGPGVPGEALARLFDPFYRPDATRSREQGGAGLGLAIVKTCVEACGGTVSARNREPRGLEVTIRLLAIDLDEFPAQG